MKKNTPMVTMKSISRLSKKQKIIFYSIAGIFIFAGFRSLLEDYLFKSNIDRIAEEYEKVVETECLRLMVNSIEDWREDRICQRLEARKNNK